MTVYAASAAALTKADLGLGNVTNTSDIDKPISTAQAAADAAILARGRRGVFGGGYIFTDRNRPHANALTDGIAVSATSRIRYVALKATSEIRLLFDNHNILTNQVDNITVKASLDIGGVLSPVFFGGARSKLIEPGGTALSDPVAVDVAVGDYVFIRSHVIVASGGKWSRQFGCSAPNGEGSNYTAGVATPAADLTDSGTVPTGGLYAYCPVGVLASSSTTFPPVTVAGIGDSIMVGSGTGDSENPWIRVALDAVGIPHFNLGKNAETAQTFVTAAGYRERMRLTDGAKYAIVMYGTNDLNGGRTAAQILADLTTIGNRCVARGMTPYICTILPRTTSSDGFLTPGNQTVTASEAARVTANTAIRAGLSPYGTNIIETADAVETARNSGLWKTTGVLHSYTDDGTHPLGAAPASTALAATVPVSQFV